MKIFTRVIAAVSSLLAMAPVFADDVGPFPGGTVPEPSSIALVVLAVGAAAFVARRNKK